MVRSLYAIVHLIVEAQAARRDARIRFLKAQVEILRRKLGGNRVIPGPDDRARLLAIGAELDHRVADVIGIVTPRTYSRWVIEQREGRKSRTAGRPRIGRDVCELVQRLARENAGWGYRRIIGELRKLRLSVGRSSVRRILKDAGLTPSPTRRGRTDETAWRTFIRLHMNTLVACDFFTKAVITPLGVRLANCLAFIHVGSRKVFLSPATFHPNGLWVQQQGRNLLMWLEDHNLPAKFIVHDRDTKFSLAFRTQMSGAGMRWVRTPLMAPDANAFAESWIGSLKRECLNYFVCFSLRHLDYITQSFVDFYNTCRPHQGLANRILQEAATGSVDPSVTTPHAAPTAGPFPDVGRIRCRRFLGGLLRHYYRDAA
ncbi:MAG: transposase [Phycisphaerales bacterium]|nr:transposase [Phycisphaerales bacterium]